jgi:hypothetical protein
MTAFEPNDLAERLRKLMARQEEHVAGEEPLTLRQACELARAAGLRTPAESVALVRADRDANGRGEREPS